jgi:F420H(2)-dependent quinone reductase
LALAARPQPHQWWGVSVDGIGKAFLGLAQRVGSTRAGVLAIGRIVSPLQRELYRRTGGRVSLTGRAPVLLLTTTGRRTGKARTVPLLYLRDGDRLVVCNVNPGFERPNPWVLNLRADPHAQIQLGRSTARVRARPASRHELDRYWPQLTQRWPAYQDFYNKGGQRSVFVLEPHPSPSPSQ